jgi:hypothetical protein
MVLAWVVLAVLAREVVSPAYLAAGVCALVLDATLVLWWVGRL